MAVVKNSIYRGWNAPFVGGNQGLMSLQSDERLIKNDILQLLLTSPGERVMMPNFGTPIRTAPFEQLDQVTTDELERAIRRSLDAYEKRVIVDDVLLSRIDEHNLLDIKIFVRLRTDIEKKLLIEAKVKI
jgi:hypothetical protein